MKRRWWLVAAILAGALVLIASSALAVRLPYAGFSSQVFVDLPRGTPVLRMADLLEVSGVVRFRWQFLLVRLMRPRAVLQAGEYRFANRASAWEVFDRLVRGDVFLYEVRVPEGSNIFDIAAVVDRMGLIADKDFLAAASDPSMIRDLATAAPSLEGYLFPSTYHITRHTTAEQLCRLMTAEFRRNWEQLGVDNRDVHSLVTLASLVEKETSVPEERPLVASVFQNRLERKMRLECDPTTIYAALLEDRYRGAIYRSDLDSTNSFNTYRHAGLPPGAIANPGLASLRAAAEPSQTKLLFFVARPDGSGAHEFSENLRQHQAAVSRYRRGLQQAEPKEQAKRVPAKKTSRRRR